MIRAQFLSYVYRKMRARLIRDVYEKQAKQKQPKDLEEVVESGDKKLRQLLVWASCFSIPRDIGVRLHDLYFPSPLTLASFKGELDIIDVWLRFGLGGACLKTVLPGACEGNSRPRLRECVVNGEECFINSLGLPGKGVDCFIDELKNSPVLQAGKPVGLSVGGDTLDEYVHTFKKLHSFVQTRSEVQFYYELNISCPNTARGKDLSYHPSLIADLLLALRAETKNVIGVKVSPDVSNKQLMLIAKTVSLIPRTYMNLGNTPYVTCDSVNLPKDALNSGGGGLSGPVLYTRTLEMTRLIAPDIPVIATGGVGSAEQVQELRTAGATLVGMASAIVKDPYCIPIINNALRNHFSSSSTLGSSHEK